MKTFSEFQQETQELFSETSGRIIEDTLKSTEDEKVKYLLAASKLFEYRLAQYHKWVSEQLEN